MSTALLVHIRDLIANKTEFQVQLRGIPAPIGPGIVELIDVYVSSTDGSPTAVSQLCRMIQLGMMQLNPQARPVKVKVPYVFDPADVLMVIEAPVNADGDKLVTTPGGSRTAGGIIVGAD